MLIDALGVVSTLVTFELANSATKAHNITRNFIARGKKTLDSIRLLWQTQAYSDCWSLHRTLIDRLFHLHVLGRDDSFEAFDGWSFVQQYEARNAVMSDREKAPKLVRKFWTPTDEQKARYRKLKDGAVKWERPKAEAAARSLGLPFLYKYGYDFASTHVHPMANDGEEEFKRATGLGEQPSLEYRVILHNSVLAQVVLVQEAIRVVGVKWNPMLPDFLDAALEALLGKPERYKLIFLKIGATAGVARWSDLPKPGGA